MGSRSRSIRVRIYFLVAIPLVAMAGLLAYVAGTSIRNAVDLDRAPDLINATALPAAKFGRYLEAERAAAVVYLSRPTPASLQAYGAAIANTTQNQAAFTTALTSGATVGSEAGDEAKAIAAIGADLNQLGVLREAVKARVLSPLQALAAYSEGTTAEARLFLAEANSVSDTSELGQALGLIAIVQAREQLSQEEALLSGALAARRMTQKERVAFTGMAAARQADTQYADTLLSPANQAVYNASLAGSGSTQQDLTGIEQAVAAGVPVTRLPLTQAEWQGLAGTLLQDQYNGGVAVARAILVADHKITHSAWVRVAVTSGIALLGLLVTIVVTALVGHGIIRRLSELERSALTLARDQLPDLVARLRQGEDVDPAAEAPPLEIGPAITSEAATGRAKTSRAKTSRDEASRDEASRDEIGRVSQAFDLVRQTAIGAAVDEARLRRGLNDVFRSLARRSQSLLHRQLSLLDQMERRANDPEALDDLFRLDHLTTRMRRHAEGLVILAGGPAGRGWSSPVRMVDVMRGAVAEVEDYARVNVATRSQAALAGSAVADIIHLLAELVENATTMSPPYTSVRVSGDTVANGFAIEVEDRGLGMSPQRLDELNERLASPPEFNPSDSEQLGLFVVGQLAKRHGIRVTLKASPYGGTSAIVLIPGHLVVTADAFRAGLPGGPAAIGTDPRSAAAANGNHAAASPAGSGPFPALRQAPEIGVPGTADAAGIRISGALRPPQADAPDDHDLSPGAHAPAPANRSGPDGGAAGGPEQDAFDVFMPRHAHGSHEAAPYPSEPAPVPGEPAPVPGEGAPVPGEGAPVPGEPAPVPGEPAPVPGWDGNSAVAADAVNGLPRRVKQASLAPQLRADPPPRGGAGVAGFAGIAELDEGSPASGPTPEEIGRTLSALQWGWQQGRSQGTPGLASDAPSPGPAAGQEAPDGGQPRGEADGT